VGLRGVYGDFGFGCLRLLLRRLLILHATID
jgi:hypothetical protein